MRHSWQRSKSKLRSTLEDKVNKELEKFLGTDLSKYYEAETLTYSVPEKIKRYTPDFKLADGVFIETKGIWDKEDRDKICLLKKQRPDIKILMLFWNASYKIYPGAKTTYADFCDAQGIDWADARMGVPSAWLAYITEPHGPVKKKPNTRKKKDAPTT